MTVRRNTNSAPLAKKMGAIPKRKPRPKKRTKWKKNGLPANRRRTKQIRKDLRGKEPHTQEQSWLFQLPGEIRALIYHEIFVSPVTIHLAYVGAKARKFRSFQCRLPEEDQPETRQVGRLCALCKIGHHVCSPRDPSQRGPAVQVHPTESVRRNARVLGMLRSCRRVYSETIDMLYEQNTFYVENPRTILEMLKYTPQARLSAFRNFYVESPMYGYWNHNDCLERWAEVAAALERFDGLKSLCVILQPGFGTETAQEGLEKPLRTAALPALRILNAPFPILHQVEGAEFCERHRGRVGSNH